MQGQSLGKSAILMSILVIVSVLSWEYYLRAQGYTQAYNDGDALWYKNREEVYTPADRATVFIGSSRIKFDIDIPTWDSVTGEKAIQLGIAGSDPRMALDNLADDAKFRGKLVIDITEMLFFSPGPDHQLTTNLKYLKTATPSQKFSSQLGFGLESQFIFLQKDLFSLGAMLDDLRIPDRKGVESTVIFPKKFSNTNFARQEKMTAAFVRDTVMQRKVKDIWTIFGALDPTHGVTGDTLQKIINEVQRDVAKIRARGGKVIFTRTPSSGGYWKLDPIKYPRAEYFDRLLAVTGCDGIYFTDYPELKNFTCPEWSHLKPTDAVLYTRSLIKILKQKNWFAGNAVKVN